MCMNILQSEVLCGIIVSAFVIDSLYRICWISTVTPLCKLLKISKRPEQHRAIIIEGLIREQHSAEGWEQHGVEEENTAELPDGSEFVSNNVSKYHRQVSCTRT